MNEGSRLTTASPNANIEQRGKKSNNTEKTKHLKRYNLVLPDDLFNEIQQIADEKGTTVLEVLRRFIKLGLIAYKLENDPNSSLIIREGDKEREIIML